MDFELDYLKDEKNGDWEISTFEISESFAKLRNVFERNPDMYYYPGKYKELTYKKQVIMSNTQMERKTHILAINKAKGNVLVAGLGLGMFIYNIKDKDDVESITVIEKSKEVIEMVSKYFKDCKKIKIINQDIFEYKPEICFDFAFFDIWNDISEDNLKDFKILRKKFKNIPVKFFWNETLLK